MKYFELFCQNSSSHSPTYHVLSTIESLTTMLRSTRQLKSFYHSLSCNHLFLIQLSAINVSNKRLFSTSPLAWEQSDTPGPRNYDTSNKHPKEPLFIADFREIKEGYRAPKSPIFLCHGLFGFDSIDLVPTIPKMPSLSSVPELFSISSSDKSKKKSEKDDEESMSFASISRLSSSKSIANKLDPKADKGGSHFLRLPAISYWRGIKEALAENKVQVYSAAVAPTASIELRSEYLRKAIIEKLVVRWQEALQLKLVRHLENLKGTDFDVQAEIHKFYQENIKDGSNVLSLNLVGHSMGGLDARYFTARLLPEYNDLAKESQSKYKENVYAYLEENGWLEHGKSNSSQNVASTDQGKNPVQSQLIPPLPALPFLQVKSITTVATPHHGSSFADEFIKSVISPTHIPGLYKRLPSLGFNYDPKIRLQKRLFRRGAKQQEAESNNDNDDIAAFSQLTREYMENTFNKEILNDPNVAYYSYAAKFVPGTWFNIFYPTWKIIYAREGDNDGLVSVESAKWGEFMSIIDNVNHLDLINWPNQLHQALNTLFGKKPPFNAIALYLSISDMLASKGF